MNGKWKVERANITPTSSQSSVQFTVLYFSVDICPIQPKVDTIRIHFAFPSLSKQYLKFNFLFTFIRLFLKARNLFSCWRWRERERECVLQILNFPKRHTEKKKLFSAIHASLVICQFVYTLSSLVPCFGRNKIYFHFGDASNFLFIIMQMMSSQFRWLYLIP